VNAMKRSRLATLVSLFWLALFATFASAECAWVLWNTTTVAKPDSTSSVTSITPIRAYATPAGSEAAKKGAEGPRAMPGVTWMLTCLPDTVDPRGPKGK